MWLRLNRAKKSFILLEIILSLTLLSICLPFISTDTITLKRELKRTSYINQIENQLSRILFFHYYNLHDKPSYFSYVKEHQQGELLLNEFIELDHGKDGIKCPIIMTFSHHEKGTHNDFSQLNFTLKVSGLPLGLADYQTNEQNIYLKN